MITLLDYGAGNTKSIINAFEILGEEVKIVSSPSDITNAEKLVFPGVGNFGSMIDSLNSKGYINPLKDYLNSNKPFFGICLGLQALFEKSEEAPNKKGLGIFKGKVSKLQTNYSIPHIGWNGINIKKDSKILNNHTIDDKFYFVHSYAVCPEDKEIILTTTDYGQEFTSSIQNGNIIATQFHPEKSGKSGLNILKNFISKDEVNIEPVKKINKQTKLSKRIVACLDVRQNDFGDIIVTKGDQYDVRENGKVRNIGKPVELAKRYYNEGADEIVFLNITAYKNFPLKDQPMIDVLKEVSKEIFVPLTIGGGIKKYTDENGKEYSAVQVAGEYFRAGADKVSIGSEAVKIVENYLDNEKEKNNAITQISNIYGEQAVVISIDPKRVYLTENNSKLNTIKTKIIGPKGEKYCYFACTKSGGREESKVDAITLAKVCESLGAGEILLNSIDKDGTKSGFDIELISAVSNAVRIPVIASSGAGNREHFYEVFNKTNVEAALGAGIFHRNEVGIKEIKEYLEKKELEIRK